MAQSKPRNLLIIIDPQEDFHKGGSLAVPGADEDADRIGDIIKKHPYAFDNIIVTLDTHQYVDIGHPSWWLKKDGTNVTPFTTILAKDIRDGTYRTAKKEDAKWSLEYCDMLEKQGRFKHFIWPYHCIVGTHGHCIVAPIKNALREWSTNSNQLITYIWKGTNPKTEMYSCFKADVPVPGAPETQLNTAVLDRIRGYDNVYVCGQARSHCVRSSYGDMCDYFVEKSKSGAAKIPKVYLLTDLCSSVTGYEEPTDEWIKEDKPGSQGARSYSFCSVTESTKVDWNEFAPK